TGKHPTDAMLDIAIAGGLKVEFRTSISVSENADLVGPLMSDPYILAGASDGGAHTKFFAGGQYTTEKVYTLKQPWKWQCQSKTCGKRGYRFSLITGTIFENTKYPLKTWFTV